MAFGSLAVAAAFALASRIARSSGTARHLEAGVLAATLTGLSVFQIWWSMEMRMYMLAGTMLALSSYALARWLWPSASGSGERGDDYRWLALHHLAALAALLTIYMSALAVAIFNLAVGVGFAIGEVDRRGLGRWIAAQAAVVVAYLPWLILAVPRMESWTSITEPASIAFVTRLWATLLATGVSTDLDSVGPSVFAFWLAVGLCVAVPAWHRVRGRRQGGCRGEPRSRRRQWLPSAVLLGCFAVLPAAFVWAATQPRSLFYSPQVEARYLLPFAVPVYVLVALLVAQAAGRLRWSGPVLAALLMAPMALHLPGYYAERRLKNDLYAMSLAIWSQSEPGDVVLLVSGNRYPLFHYYYDLPWQQPMGVEAYELPEDDPPAWSERPSVVDFPDHGTAPVTAYEWEERLGKIVREYNRVWLVEVGRGLQDPDGVVQSWLNEHLARVLSEAYGADALHLYSRDSEPPRVTGLSSRFPGTLRLASTPEQPGLAPIIGGPPRSAIATDELNVSLFLDATDAAVATLRLIPTAYYRQDGAPLAAARTEGVAASSAELGGAERPEPRRLRLVFDVDERLPGGSMSYRAEWSAPGPTSARPIQEAVGTTWIRGNPPNLTTGVRLSGARVGPAILVDYQCSASELAAGGDLILDLHWRPSAGAESPRQPVVFTHLIGPPHPESGETVWAGHDGPPSSGPWPWELALTREAGFGDDSGDWLDVFDRHRLLVDPDAPPGVYELEVGLYDLDTGERYEVSGSGADPAARRLLLAEIEVR